MTDSRLMNPFDIVRGNAQRRAGVPDAREERLEQLRSRRYDDATPLDAMIIGWQAPDLGAGDQLISLTTFENITCSVFELSFPGNDDAMWATSLTYRIIVASTGAADTDVFSRIQIDWGDTVWRDPDIDLSSAHGAVSAFGIIDYAESAGTGVAFSLKPTAVLKVRGGSTIRVRAVARIGTAGQTATIQTTVTSQNPHCVGTGIPYRRVR